MAGAVAAARQACPHSPAPAMGPASPRPVRAQRGSARRLGVPAPEPHDMPALAGEVRGLALGKVQSLDQLRLWNCWSRCRRCQARLMRPNPKRRLPHRLPPLASADGHDTTLCSHSAAARLLAESRPCCAAPGSCGEELAATAKMPSASIGPRHQRAGTREYQAARRHARHWRQPAPPALQVPLGRVAGQPPARRIHFAVPDDIFSPGTLCVNTFCRSGQHFFV